MKKLALLPLLLSIFLSGCATYKFHHGQVPYDKGYVVSRDDYTIVEYTIGAQNSVPERKSAKVRFLRRRHTVEDFYKRMGKIENRFKMAVADPAVMFLKLIGGVFRLPFIAISDYRYEHNPQYRERVKKLEKEKDAQEEARVKHLQEKLDAYIQKDLEKKEPVSNLALVVTKEPLKPTETKLAVEEKVEVQKAVAAPIAQEEKTAVSKFEEAPQIEKQSVVEQKPQEEKTLAIEQIPESAPVDVVMEPKEDAAVVKERTVEALTQKKEKEADAAFSRAAVLQNASSPLKAMIVARPSKGISPLKVHFYGNQSRSRVGKIVSYTWDFGDGDTSIRVNPANTFYSGSFTPKIFNVTLTVTDNKRNTATTSIAIEVLNK